MTAPGWDDFGKLVDPVSEKPPKIVKAPFRGGSVEYDGTAGEIDSGAIAGAPNWDDIIRRFGFDPEEVEVVEPVRISAWDAQTPDGIQTMFSHRARLQSRSRPSSDIEQIMADVVKHKPPRVAPPSGDTAFCHVSGDCQTGKEGTEAMVRRFLDSLSTGPARLRELRKAGRQIGTVVLPWVGDMVEGVSGHYASQTHTTELTMMEQMRVIRRLTVKLIQTYAPLAKEIIVPIAPGNHDELRNGGGKAFTKPSDNFATEIASIISDMVDANPEVYGHVKIYVPDGEKLDVTLDVCGTVMTVCHGHQFPRGDAMKWWAGQSHGLQSAGQSTLLIAGHLHHLRVIQDGVKTFVQVPALDSGSQWFATTTGKDAPPGTLTMTVGGGGWGDLQVL